MAGRLLPTGNQRIDANSTLQGMQGQAAHKLTITAAVRCYSGCCATCSLSSQGAGSQSVCWAMPCTDPLHDYLTGFEGIPLQGITPSPDMQPTVPQ